MQSKEHSENIKQFIIENPISSWNLKCFPFDLKLKIKFAFLLQSYIILTWKKQ